jgi:putative peptidoglycan lipid II flippase
MAVASLVSRITGFLRQLALVAVLGLGVVNDSYTVANTLPNIVYELLLGGVLTSVMVPLLIRAQTEDADGGEAYTRRLLTMAGAALAVATLVAMATAALLTRLYLGGSGSAHGQLATAFAWLLLPQIFFYGVGAMLGALLNTRGVFGPFAWAPVLNNVVVLGVLAAFVAVPGEISLDPVRLGDPKLLVLGIGTTLGIVAQALILIPSVRRTGFRYRPLWGWDRRLSETGGLAVWVVAYVLIGQAGYIVTTRVAADAAPGSVAIYANAWLLLQVPYGVLGVSLLTALMPRMSRAAAEGRITDVVADLALGTRLSAVVLLPVSALLTLFGTQLGVALFSFGAGSAGEGSTRLGATLAASAFGLLPFAVMMLQARVFYALKDSRTPTLLQLVIVVVKIPLLLAAPFVLPPQWVVLGLAAANGMSFVVGWILGQVLLRWRLGPLGTGRVLGALLRMAVASVVGAGLAFGVVLLVGPALPAVGPVAGSWIELGIAAVIGGPVVVAVMLALRIPEVAALRRRVTGKVAHPTERGESGR